ncbi:MAG TPA: peptidoglycan endopeptidase [Thermoanaerobacter sp.]|nr:peptidoglycan endopeptidase [Thermoanaerobacter sp.]
MQSCRIRKVRRNRFLGLICSEAAVGIPSVPHPTANSGGNKGRRFAVDQRIGKMIFGISVFGATLIGSSFLNPAFAEGLGVGKITGNYVNVRTQGSLSGSIITRLNLNDTVTVLDQQNGWYKIKLSDGKEGWVFGEYLALVNGQNAPVTGVGTVTGSRVNVRSAASLSASIITQLAKNTVVDVLGKQNDWYKVRLSNNKEGWIYSQYLAVKSVDTTVSRGSVNRTPIAVGIVTGSVVNVRSAGNISANVIAQVTKNTKVDVLGNQNGWYNIRLSDGREGWIYGQYLSVGTQTIVSRGDVDRSVVNKLIEFAKSLLGTKYVYGGSSPAGFDCSGFVQYVFKNFDINLLRTAKDQSTVGEYVSYSNLQPGDLVFFKTLGSSVINHSGIYIGNGEFIHSSSGAGKVIISNITSGYYKDHYTTARRVIR